MTTHKCSQWTLHYPLLSGTGVYTAQQENKLPILWGAAHPRHRKQGSGRVGLTWMLPSLPLTCHRNRYRYTEEAKMGIRNGILQTFRRSFCINYVFKYRIKIAMLSSFTAIDGGITGRHFGFQTHTAPCAKPFERKKMLLTIFIPIYQCQH